MMWRYKGTGADDAERFWSRVARSEGCWEWTGSLSGGYGDTHYDGRPWRTHRLAYTLTFGPIPDGLYVCHHCDNPKCVRPDHLFLGTPRDNALDMRRKGRSKNPKGVARATHCKYGHPTTGEHEHVTPSGRRKCLVCDRRHKADYRARQKARHTSHTEAA